MLQPRADCGRGAGVAVGAHVSDEAQARTATAESFGPVAPVVNSARIAGDPGPMQQTGAANWAGVTGMNQDRVAFAPMAAIGQMGMASGGSIGIISSAGAHAVLTLFPAPFTSKHAPISLTKGTAAGDAAQHSRIDSLPPGVIGTPLTMAESQKEVTDRFEAKSQHRPGEPREIANPVTFLLLHRSGRTSGSDLSVDGGFLLREYANGHRQTDTRGPAGVSWLRRPC